MDSSLWWLIVLLSLFAVGFVLYLSTCTSSQSSSASRSSSLTTACGPVLSTCMGPQLVQLFRAWINRHCRSSKRAEWDLGGGGYRELSASSRSTRRAFLDGRGGNEGYEMATFGADD